MQDFPAASFPYQLNARGQQREVFGSFGLRSQYDVASDESLRFQRNVVSKEQLVAAHPVLPLSFVTENVYEHPLRDKLMGDILDDRCRKKTFSETIRRLVFASKSSAKLQDVRNIQKALTICKKARACKKTECFQDLEDKMPKWFKKLRQDYSDIAAKPNVQINNSRYAGGVLACHKRDETRSILLSPTGKDFTQLKVTSVHEESDGILRGDNLQTIPLYQPVSRVVSKSVQGFDLFVALSEEKCVVYKLENDAKEKGPLTLKYQTVSDDLLPWVSCDISPYVAGEMLLMKKDGRCYYRTLSELQMAFETSPRFPIQDPWCMAYFGEHPRQVIHADLTAVQLYDIRKPSPEAVDIFALPNKFLQLRERIRMCEKLRTAPFYHLVATDYSLVLADQRFTKYPVLQWDHVLSSPPQYLSCLSRTSTLSSDSTATSVFIGSQFPAQVHALVLQQSHNNPPQALGSPWRLASTKDLSEWVQFTDECCNPLSLGKRLNTSLAGIQATAIAGNQVVFQVDSYGEIFYQAFRVGAGQRDITFSAGPGSQNLVPSVEAVRRAKLWIDSYDAITKQAKPPEGRILYKNVTNLVQGNQSQLPAHVKCSLCMPHIVELLERDGQAPDQRSSVCLSCSHTIDTSQNLVQAVTQDSVISNPSETLQFRSSLDSIDAYPATSALSRLLLKQWNKDADIGDIMKDWDREVLEKRKTPKKKSNRASELPDMSEESVLQRLMLRSQDASRCSEGVTANQSVSITDIQDADTQRPFEDENSMISRSEGLISDSESERGDSLASKRLSEDSQVLREDNLSRDTLFGAPRPVIHSDFQHIMSSNRGIVNDVLPSCDAPTTTSHIVGVRAAQMVQALLQSCETPETVTAPQDTGQGGDSLYGQEEANITLNTAVSHVDSGRQDLDSTLLASNDEEGNGGSLRVVSGGILLQKGSNSQDLNSCGSEAAGTLQSEGLSQFTEPNIKDSELLCPPFVREQISPARSNISNMSMDLFSSPEPTRRKRKRQNSGSSTCSNVSNISINSFPGFLSSPRKLSNVLSPSCKLGRLNIQQSLGAKDDTHGLTNSVNSALSSQSGYGGVLNSRLQFTLSLSSPVHKSPVISGSPSGQRKLSSKLTSSPVKGSVRCSPAKQSRKRYDGF